MNALGAFLLTWALLCNLSHGVELVYSLQVAPAGYNQSGGCGFYTLEATSRCNASGGAFLARADVGSINPVSNSDGLAWPVWQIIAVAVGGGIGLALLFLLCFLASWCFCCNPANNQNKVAAEPGDVVQLGQVPHNPGVYPMQYPGMKGPPTSPMDTVPAGYGPGSNANGPSYNGPMTSSQVGSEFYNPFRKQATVPRLDNHQSLRDLGLGMEQYERLEEVGNGTYGTVYRARDRNTGEIRAMKKIRLENEEEGVPSNAIREISLLKELNHPCVVRLFDVAQRDRSLYLVFEFMELDLKKHMDASPNFRHDKKLIKTYLWQILSAVTYVHSRRIFHRDLKPQNLLIDRSTHQLKLADFGLARAFGVPLRAHTHEVVTLWYRAPEILLGSNSYSTPVDIWSIGCIFAEMCNHHPLFPGETEIGQLFVIFEALGTPNEATWPGLRDYQDTFPKRRAKRLDELVPSLDPAGLDLLARMLVYSPQNRITAADALQDTDIDIGIDTYSLQNRITSADALQHEYFADIAQTMEISTGDASLPLNCKASGGFQESTCSAALRGSNTACLRNQASVGSNRAVGGFQDYGRSYNLHFSNERKRLQYLTIHKRFPLSGGRMDNWMDTTHDLRTQNSYISVRL
eukprot:gene14625-20659_t